MKSKTLLLFAALAMPGMALADTITLNDGTTIDGDIKRTGDVYTIKQPNGKTSTVPVEKVLSFEVKPAAGNDAAMSRLQSLRRACDNLSDIKTIIERFKNFIDQNPGTPACEAAKADLKTWQDRLDRGMVKAGDKWMTTADREALRSKSIDVAILLHDMIKQGRLKESTPILEHSLAIDPQNISLLYVHGVTQYMQEFLVPARKDFEAVMAAAPDHAPTLNNLAVILWRQKAIVPSVGYYDRALLAAPNSQEILDNIAEALNALPKEQRESPVVKKLVRHFKEQDDALQKRMGEKGLYRWGSSWLTEKEIKKLQDDETVIKDQIKQMETDFASAQARITAIDQQIASINDQMRTIDLTSYATAPNGTMYRLPYPPIYFTLGQQAATLKTERASKVDDLDRLRKTAKAAVAKLPAPKYSGIQKIIDVDGLPLPVGIKLPTPPRPVPPTQPAGPSTSPVPPMPPAVAAPEPATMPATPTTAPSVTPTTKPAQLPTTRPTR